MSREAETWTNNPEKLQQMLLEAQTQLLQKDKEITQLKQEFEQKYQQLLEQFRLAQQRSFGKSSESYPPHPDLFNEVEAELEIPEPEVETQEISYTRKKPVRRSLPKDLPREIVIHDLAEDEKTCDCCGHDLHQMGETRSEQLEFIPAQVKVIEHLRFKYSCR